MLEDYRHKQEKAKQELNIKRKLKMDTETMIAHSVFREYNLGEQFGQYDPDEKIMEEEEAMSTILPHSVEDQGTHEEDTPSGIQDEHEASLMDWGEEEEV